MPAEHEHKFFLVEADMLPEIFIKVAKAKELLETGEAPTVAEAANMVEISRSAFRDFRGGEAAAAIAHGLEDGILQIGDASEEELCEPKGISANDAKRIYEYFHGGGKAAVYHSKYAVAEY